MLLNKLSDICFILVEIRPGWVAKTLFAQHTEIRLLSCKTGIEKYALLQVATFINIRNLGHNNWVIRGCRPFFWKGGGGECLKKINPL